MSNTRRRSSSPRFFFLSGYPLALSRSIFFEEPPSKLQPSAMWRGQQPIVGGLVIASILLVFLSTVASQCHLHVHDGEVPGGTDSEEIQGAEEVAFVDGATYNTTQDKPCGN